MIHLRELSQINYLVGQNGSGKSLLLKHIFENNPSSFYIKDCDNQKNTERFYALENVENIHLDDPEYKEMIEVLPEIADFYKSPGPERTGFDKLIKVCKLIWLIKKEFFKSKDRSDRVPVFLIEEPEIHLHPSLQKLIPVLLQKIVIGLKAQIFVETHSPFIVSKAGSLVQIAEDNFDKKHRKFKPSQKVYFLKNGSLADKNGIISGKGEFGYWGSKVSLIGAKMLGAGLSDFIRPLESDVDSDSPTIVFCEGQGKDQDAKLYNIIFRDHWPRMMFVSSRGSSQLESSFQVISEVKYGLSANFNILLLRDRDHEFSDENEIILYQKNHKGARVLRRRAIECYLFNSESLELIYKSNYQELPASISKQMVTLSQKIQAEAENGVLGDDYKYRLHKEFIKSLNKLKLSQDFYLNLEENIAWLITPKTDIYKELEAVIFAQNVFDILPLG